MTRTRDVSPCEEYTARHHRCGPTDIFPAPRIPLRTTFKNFHRFATVVVGTGKSAQKYTLHTDLLTSCSPFFAAALNGSFAEATDQTVTLEEEKPETFEWFIQWLYTGTLTTAITPSCSSTSSPSISPPSRHSKSITPNPTTSPPILGAVSTHTDGDLRNSAGSPKYFLLLDLYALSDRLLTSDLSNTILDTIARLSEATNSVPTPSDTYILYDSIRATAPIRTLILDLFTYKKTDKLLETHNDEWHPRFMREGWVRSKRPGREALERHELREWRCVAYQLAVACRGCKEVVGPTSERAVKCEVCCWVYCASCVARGEGGSLVGGEVGPCKPWLRGACRRYHEHGPAGR